MIPSLYLIYYVKSVNLDEEDGDGQDGCYPMTSTPTKDRPEEKRERPHVATQEQEHDTGMK